MTVLGFGEENGNGRGKRQTQIPFGDDNKKSKGKRQRQVQLNQWLEFDGGGVDGGLGVFELEALHEVDDDR
jgi:hypothetical protein